MFILFLSLVMIRHPTKMQQHETRQQLLTRLEGLQFPQEQFGFHRISENSFQISPAPGVLIVLMCHSCWASFLSNVSKSDGRSSISSHYRHIIISILEWGFCDLPPFLNSAQISLPVISEVDFLGSATHQKSSCCLISSSSVLMFSHFSSSHNFSLRAWRLLMRIPDNVR